MHSPRHEALPASLTPPPPYLDATKVEITLYDIDGTPPALRLPARRSDEITDRHVTGLNDDVVLSHHINVLETTPEKRAMEDVARAFVAESFGIMPTTSLYWQPDKTFSGQRGVHSAAYDATYVADWANENLHHRYMEQMALLVHEFAHAAGNPHQIEIFHNHQAETFHVYTRLGMEVIKISQRDKPVTSVEGLFFEEALAEETAARWRESHAPLTNQYPDYLFNRQARTVPLRFYDYDSTATRHVDIGHRTKIIPSYAAYGLSLLSATCGADLYELMIQTRWPDKAASAKRTFIDAINSVEDGLYQKLRHVPYTAESFVTALNDIRTLTSR